MSAQGDTPGDARVHNPNDTSGGPSGIKSSTPPSDPSATSQQPVKAKPKSLQEEIRDILLAKTIEATHGLKQLMLPQSVLEKAAETVATRATNEIIAAACKYARESAKALKFTCQDLLDEVLVAKGIAPRKPRRTKAANKNSKKNKKGGCHGNKS